MEVLNDLHIFFRAPNQQFDLCIAFTACLMNDHTLLKNSGAKFGLLVSSFMRYSVSVSNVHKIPVSVLSIETNLVLSALSIP